MAGYRLSPKAAKARRRPWQRRRLYFGVPYRVSATAADTIAITSTASVVVALTRTAADSISLTSVAGTGQVLNRSAADTITIASTASASVGQGQTAQGPSLWLFKAQSGAPQNLIRAAADSLVITTAASGSFSGVTSYSRSASSVITIFSSAGASILGAFPTGAVVLSQAFTRSNTNVTYTLKTPMTVSDQVLTTTTVSSAQGNVTAAAPATRATSTVAG